MAKGEKMRGGGEAMIDNFAIAIAVSMTLTGLSVAVSGVGVFWGLAERG